MEEEGEIVKVHLDSPEATSLDFRGDVGLDAAVFLPLLLNENDPHRLPSPRNVPEWSDRVEEILSTLRRDAGLVSMNVARSSCSNGSQKGKLTLEVVGKEEQETKLKQAVLQQLFPFYIGTCLPLFSQDRDGVASMTRPPVTIDSLGNFRKNKNFGAALRASRCSHGLVLFRERDTRETYFRFAVAHPAPLSVVNWLWLTLGFLTFSTGCLA